MDPVLILNKILGFILSLYGEPSLQRKVVQNVIDYFHEFLKETYLPSLQNDIMDILKNEKISDYNLHRIQSCFNKYGNIFENVNTENKRFALLKPKGFIDREEFFIGRVYETVIIDNKEVSIPENMYGIRIPLRNSLKVFLEIPGLFDKILNYMNSVSKSTSIISNLIQADLWKSKSKKFINDIVLPLYIFYDDLEVGNALGSRAGTNKFGAVYASIACLPPEIASRLDCIIFSSLFHTTDKKESSNAIVFKHLMEELNFLSKEGILINNNGVKQRVKFQLVLILGDNLGLNGIFGFKESFKAKYYCRICKGSSEECSQMIVEDESILRTKENYDQDVQLRNSDLTGIKERCIFNKVANFHITENLTVDMMHDFLEGVCAYVLNSLLNDFIFVEKYITLNELNTRIQNFNYGHDDCNKPPIIKRDGKNNCLNLKTSAAEMLTLMRFLGIIIGDVIPPSDNRWNLYKYCRQILDILMSPRVVRGHAALLKNLIENLNKLYLEIYGKLKPKFHFLVHYPRIMMLNGPIIKFWSMRFESYHQIVKSNANTSSNTINLLKTIATKQALKLCEIIHCLKFDSQIKFSKQKRQEKKAYFQDKKQNEIYTTYERVETDGNMYDIGTFVVIDVGKIEKVFGKICDIISLNNEIYFDLQLFEEISFDFHVHAYIIVNKNEKRFIKYTDLPMISPFYHVNKNNEDYLISKYIL